MLDDMHFVLMYWICLSPRPKKRFASIVRLDIKKHSWLTLPKYETHRQSMEEKGIQLNGFLFHLINIQVETKPEK